MSENSWQRQNFCDMSEFSWQCQNFHYVTISMTLSQLSWHCQIFLLSRKLWRRKKSVNVTKTLTLSQKFRQHWKLSWKLISIAEFLTHFEVAKNPIYRQSFACLKFSCVNFGPFLCTQKNFIPKYSTNHE